jgi:tRNA G18 (ribose-2'-O)-methylase SpoU
VNRSFNIRPVSSLQQSGLEPYLTLRRPDEHLRKGIFVAEGGKVVLRLLAAALDVDSILVTPPWLERVSREPGRERETPLTVFLAEQDLVRQIVGYRLHQGIMAVGRVPPEPSIDDIPDRHLLVALDGLSQAENVGVIVRNCAGFAVDAVISGETSCSPYLRRAVRNSMGGVFSLPVHHARDLAETLAWLRRRKGTRIVVADAHGTTAIRDVRLDGNICLVAGNEEAGASEGVLNIADERVVIPMGHRTDSLNVASAAAVFLYEARRQRSNDANMGAR